MFSDQTKDTIRSLSEIRLIEQLRAWLGPVTPPSPAGMGDDCALHELSAGVRQLLTTDSLTYGQHFDDQVGPKEAGAKLIKRNLSDIAAMGGEPGPALLNLLMGPNLSIEWLEKFISGIRESCLDYKVSIAGGDVSELAPSQFTAVLSLTGQIAGPPKLRHGAAIGESIYVTGELGGSILGKHYNLEPRIKEGQWLATRSEVSAMMDLTDGLGKDLAALIPVECSAAIRIGKIPVSAAAKECSERDGLSPEAHAFTDGEDYELLFTVAKDAKLDSFESEWRECFPDLLLSKIGTITEGSPAGRYIDATTKEALPWQSGFEHFKV